MTYHKVVLRVQVDVPVEVGVEDCAHPEVRAKRLALQHFWMNVKEFMPFGIPAAGSETKVLDVVPITQEK